MNRIILTLACFWVFFNTLNAQIAKNTHSLGGFAQLGYQSQLFNYSVNSHTKINTTDFNVLPRYASFLTDKLMLEASPIVRFRVDNIVSRLDTNF